MANLLNALAASAKDRVSSSVKDAKESVVNQFDPRKSIYGLGMGVGPLIRQTVAEYKKQQSRDSEKSSKKTAKDVVDIKAMAATNKTGLNKMNAQLSAMNSILGDIRKINIAQLQALKVNTSNVRQSGAFGGGISASDSLAREEGSMSKLGKWLADKFPGATATAAGGVAAVAAYKYKDEIKQAFEDYLKGAGLPNSEVIQAKAIEQIEKSSDVISDKISKAVTKGIATAITDLPQMIVDTWWNNMKLAVGLDKNNDPTEANKRPLASQVGGTAGAALGFKYAPAPFKVHAAIAGYVGGKALGDYSPEGVLGGTALAMGGYGAYKLHKANAASKAAEAAAQATQAAARAAPAPAAMPTQPWQTPTGAPASSIKMTPGGIIIPEAARTRSPEAAKSMAEAASKTLSAADKAGVAARNTVSSLAKYGREAASIVSKYGKSMVGLGAILGLPDIYDDIKDGDYAAAGVRAATLIGSTAIGLTGFISGGAGFVAGTGLSIGGNYAADKLKAPKPAQSPSATNQSSSDQPTSNVSPNEKPTGARPGGDLPPWVPDRIRNNPEFIKELNRVAESLGVDPVDLLAVMKAESGIYANIQNGRKPGDPFVPGKATGLIQFMPATAKDLGTTTDALFTMNETEQLKYVEKYFKKSRLPRGAKAGEIYGHVFAPAATRNADFVMYRSGTAEYAQNAGLDYGNKGYITRADLDTRIASNVGASAPSQSGMQSFHATEGVRARMRGMGLSDEQVQSIEGFSAMVRELNSLGGIFAGNFDTAMQAPYAAEPSTTPNGGSTNKTPPSVPPVSMYKEKHSFGQAKAPWYASGGTLPAFQ